MSSINNTADVAAVVVTYNPDYDAFKLNINSYVSQVGCTIIVDNSTEIEIQQKIRALESDTIKVFSLGGNKGIAEAQNVGIQYACKSEFQYILEIDQDSRLVDNYVNALREGLKKLLSEGKNVAAIGALAVDEATGIPYDPLEKNTGIVEVKKTLSSGSLFSAEVIKKVGLKDSGMFIDLVDWEWGWRANSTDLKMFVDTDTLIYHNLGQGNQKVLNFKVGVPAPVRHYYAFRNSLYLFSKPYVPFSWKFRTVFLLGFKLLTYGFFLPEGRKRFNYMILGIKDYLRGKKGIVNG